ncbi:asparaginase domain-containing protein [Maribacter sp. 2308TA10-17]|uniref:asparaginase domain-containing protein n=1 Tax=Maribacter sp. 2308TA10-17 TaxID=3386276 RepID=UPI0039BCD386
MIQVITTGGTIEGLEYSNEQDKPLYANVRIKDFLKAANVSFKYFIHDAFNKDSRFITKEDRKLLLQKIESCNLDKILITHGTITMIETAKYLGNLNLEKTIVLVGSFLLGNERNTDAPFNLGYAICALKILGRGVFIAMNGRIFSWNNVVKNVDENRFEENDN